MAKNAVKAVALSTILSANLTVVYLPFAPLSHSCFFVRIANGGTTPVIISLDGVTDNDAIPVGQSLELNCQTNAQPSGKVSQFPKGQIFFVRSTSAPGTGTVTLAGYYNDVAS